MSTGIEWADEVWNAITGCTRCSPGCRNCYALKMTRRQQGMGRAKYQNGETVTCHPNWLTQPQRWRKPRRVFVNSMSDTFHADVPDSFIVDTFRAMADAPQHTYQMLTKRSERLAAIGTRLQWTPNIWCGVTVEHDGARHRIDDLRRVPAHVRWLSVEPLLTPLPNLDLRGIHWVVVGGETGSRPRPMNLEWARDVRDQCAHAGVAFFFQQIGGTKAAGRILDGVVHDSMPARE
jgi:protein gp37